MTSKISQAGSAQKMADVVTTHITRTKVTADGGSVFEQLEVPLDNKNWIGSLSRGTEVHEIVFRETDGAYDLDWHTAPCRQFIIMTNGGVDVTTTDGVTKRFADGDVLLVEDTTGLADSDFTTGKGHRSKAVDNKPRKSILVKLRI